MPSLLLLGKSTVQDSVVDPMRAEKVCLFFLGTVPLLRGGEGAT